MKNLEDKTAIITGASSGIGKQSAYKLAEKGANIVLVARRKNKLNEIAEKIQKKHEVKTKTIKTDVTKEEEVSKLVEKSKQKFGSIDIVVANAGLGVGGSVEELESEEFHKMMDVNCDGVYFTAQKAIPHLKETKGNLILIASIAGKYPRSSNPVYAATKWWVRGFGMSLSAQIGTEGVGVTMINPSEVRTEFASEDGESFAERFEEGEVTSPDDIAEAVVFAARQEEPNTVNELDLYRKDKLSELN